MKNNEKKKLNRNTFVDQEKEKLNRNTFFARLYLTSLPDAGQGLAMVCEQYFTTRQVYTFEKPEVASYQVSKTLQTSNGYLNVGTAETSNGSYIPQNHLSAGSPAGVIHVIFDVIETPGQLFQLANFSVRYTVGDGVTYTDPFYNLQVAAFAVGIVDDSGNITSPHGDDRVLWIRDTMYQDPNRSLLVKHFITLKWNKTGAFNKATVLMPADTAIPDVLFDSVYTGPEVVEPETECCENQANSLALVAAASLVASNNITSPILIKQIENAVSNGFDATSTISALQSMRQLGTLSNVAGKVLDNAVPKSTDVVVIKNGPQE